METKIDKPLRKSLWVFTLIAALSGLAACSSENTSTEQNANAASRPATEEATPAASDKGIGPVSSVQVGAEPDQALADKGKAVFESKCAACHKFDERYVGPALGGVTERRKPEWIMNMILNPQEMVQKDPTAQELLAQFMTPMPFQNVSEEEARAILEYFRSIDKK